MPKKLKKKIKYTGPRILFLDIESSPNIVTSWRIGSKINLGHDNVIKERRILCCAWKWNYDKQLYDSRSKGSSDKLLVAKVFRELRRADAVCAHNGDRFDLPYLRARGIHHGLKPPKPIKQIDTLKIARKVGYFNSNKLDYLGQFLGVGKKIKTDFGLWLECLRGDKKAMDKMVRYNKQDVVLLEKVFNKLKLYAPKETTLYGSWGNPPGSCQNLGCGGNLRTKGSVCLRTGTYKAFTCTKCGAWSRSTKADSTSKVVGA
jgi:hypothetical protein